MPPLIRTSDFDGGLSGFLGKYKYQPNLTMRLDHFEDGLTPELLNEIVLWKAACHCVVQRHYVPVEIIPAKPNAVTGSA